MLHRIIRIPTIVASLSESHTNMETVWWSIHEEPQEKWNYNTLVKFGMVHVQTNTINLHRYYHTSAL